MINVIQRLPWLRTLSPDRLRFWAARSGFSLFDQGLLSGSSFVLNILLARWVGSDEYGAFAVCFSGFLFLSGFHNVLAIEPMTVLGSSQYSGRLPGYFISQLKAHGLIVIPLVCVTLLASGMLALRGSQRSLLTAMVALGIASPLILLLYLVRRMCYVVRNSTIAAQSSVVYCAMLISGALALHQINWLSAATAFLLMGVCSLLTSTFALWRLSLFGKPASGISSLPLSRLFRENWEYGHWLVLTTALSWTTVQVQTFLAAGYLDLSAAGALRAMQLPSLVISQFITSSMLLLLPSMSQELGGGSLERLHRKAMLSTSGLFMIAASIVATLYFLASPLEHLLFGGQYSSSAWLIPVLALAPMFIAISSSLSFALRALRKAQFELISYVIAALVGVISSLVLMPRWGVTGAAFSIVASTATLAGCVVICYMKWGRPHRQAERPSYIEEVA
jgi:O-antigen/teichoic acid export membrane protein